MRALVADPAASPALSLADVPEPSPGPGELLLDMEAASVNRGEIRSAAKQPPGTVIGWDVADSGRTGRRGDPVRHRRAGGGAVAGRRRLRRTGGRPVEWTAPLPAACDCDRRHPARGRGDRGRHPALKAHAGDRVLVTGAAGGVGQFIVQLAVAVNATVTGQARSEERAGAVRAAGAEALVHPGDGTPVDGEFDVVLDGIGGPMLGPRWTPPPATAGWSSTALADAPSTFRVESFYLKGITIFGFRVFTSVPPTQVVKDMAALADQAAAGTLQVTVQATAPWPTPSSDRRPLRPQGHRQGGPHPLTPDRGRR